MGHQGSKSSIEARVIYHRFGAMDMCSAPASVVHIQKRVSGQSACLHPAARTPEKSHSHSWPQSRCDAGGLVYVMDNPTGGVWMKPEETRTRS